ncbi:di-heme oxidoredictase family protein [Glaciecola sp. SC05]|uniref:di-heme oxidoredictase family protein n=1 Tax=Glaciecola sp. SC05 TaxID=1987355 RepID=UPI0035283275
MKQHLVYLFLAFFALSGCGGGDTSEPATPNPPPVTPPPVTPPTLPPPVDTESIITALYDENTSLEDVSRFVRDDGVLITRIGDRGRDRHAKDITIQDHYDHYLAHYWEFRTARIQLEDHVPNGQSLIRATFITEAKLGAREFRVWFWGRNTTGQFHFNPQKEEAKVNPNETGVVFVGKGTWNEDFEKISEEGIQHMYTLDIVNKWENGGQFQPTLEPGMNMEFEVSQFLLNPPAGARLNYYGTSFVYVIGQTGVAPFEWERGVENQFGSNDGTPIPAKGLSGGETTLGYNYSEEPAGRFMQMATNLSAHNAQPFVEGRRVHHTNFEDGSHDERLDNPIWTEQVGKLGKHYINHSCAACHVRNGKALVGDVGESLEKWVFRVGDVSGNPHPLMGQVLQPEIEGAGVSEGQVTLGPWTELENGLRSPNYLFSNGAPPQFSARIAPQLVGLGLLEAVSESQILEWEDADDADNDGISGRASIVEDPSNGVMRLGRFGYKAGTFSVKHQSASALNTDMGVMTSMLPEPDCGSAQNDCGESGAELSEQNLDKLVKYLSLLGVGARRDYANEVGETMFADIGCASCHRPTMNTSPFHPLAELRNQTIHPYTDLLLHDMGPGLADNLAEGSASGAEWRTAPLWGLGLAKNVMLGDAKANDTISLARRSDDDTRIGYLHDGRARTIEEAILWHGGEAEVSKQTYVDLSAQDKTALLSFLESL